jgi:anaerobic magnesium-protoporphyrin IX monomethyl ester cyclase
MKPYPPLATIQAAAILRSHGFVVDLYDTTFVESHDEFNKILKDTKPDALVVYEDYFNFIIKMCLSQMSQVTQAMCRRAQDEGIITIVANPDTTYNPLKYLENGADYVIIGEPDITILEICNALASGKSPLQSKVKGIAGILPDNNVHVTESRTVFHNVEMLPMPAWDLINVEPYRRAWLENHGFFSLNISSSKGCPFSCSWCAKPIWGNNYIQRPASHIVEEVRWLVEHYKPDHLWFVDDLFGFDEEWIKAFSDSVKEYSISIKYTIQTRADLLKPVMLSLLKQSGCNEVWIGAESGSQRILDRMNKMLTVGAIKSAVKNLKAAGIRVGLFIQFGYLGETMDDIQDTVDLIRETFPDDVGISVTYPLPGTDLYRFVQNDLGNKTHWNNSDDISMLFNGSYSTNFYRKLHEVLHAELDLMHLISENKNTDIDKFEEDEKSNQVRDGWNILNRMEKTHRRTTQNKQIRI